MIDMVSRCRELDEDQVRSIVRSWIAEHVPQDWVAAALAGDLPRLHEVRSPAAYREWYPVFGRSGLVAPGWPIEAGGLGLPEGPLTEVITEELRRHRLVRLNIMGLALAGPILLAHGSRAQQRRWLPRIVTNEEIWCQLFSEPEAGSDLAGLATRATRDADGGWRIEGSKVWTSFAADARRGLLAARTDPFVPKHAGLSLFVLDMKDPLVNVRPLRKINGESEFSEVTFDGAHVDDADRVGEIGGGWPLMRVVLAHEKAMLSGRGSGGRERSSGRSFESVVALASDSSNRNAPPLGDAVVRRELALLWLESQSIRHINARAARRRALGRASADSSVRKLLQSEHNQRLQLQAARLLGERLVAHGEDDAEADDVVFGYLRSRGDTIAGGTSEVHRNQVAERALGLPREPSSDRGLPWKDVPRGPKRAND